MAGGRSKTKDKNDKGAKKPDDSDMSSGDESAGERDCGKCEKSVTVRHKGVKCYSCELWYHIGCVKISPSEYDGIQNKGKRPCTCVVIVNTNLKTLKRITKN